MAVTELALLYFKDDENPSVKEGLAQAQQAQEEHSKHKVQFLRQVGDPSYFYLLAGWESLETHIAHSAHYQGKLTQLTDRVGVDWMFHLDADPSMFEILIDTPVISIGRYFIEGSKKEELNSVFESLISHLVGSAITPFCCGAWRIDKEGDDEEYVFFSGWKEIQDHIEFENSEAAKAITTVRKLVKGVEVKHARVLKWE